MGFCMECGEQIPDKLGLYCKEHAPMKRLICESCGCITVEGNDCWNPECKKPVSQLYRYEPKGPIKVIR